MLHSPRERALDAIRSWSPDRAEAIIDRLHRHGILCDEDAGLGLGFEI
ncbi:hypothetical protein OU995_14705 [Roseateles sp. SL47]|nr:hypothetical protein [Roseateles sp. SL47]WAC70867.1 hypothetical protein OU995_14705 [Roseateles sp. SL47]